MKKLIAVFLAVGLLAACGSGEESASSDSEKQSQETATETKSEDEMSQSEWVEAESNGDVEGVERVEDPMKVSEGDVFVYGIEEYNVIDTYTNDQTTEGFNEVDFNGYHVTYSFKVIEDVVTGKKLIGFFAETENNTEDTVQYNADMTLKTSEQEQAENMTAIGETDPEMKTKGMVTVPLEYGVPDSFEVTLEPPFKKTGENSYEEGHFGEAKTMELSKE